MQNEFSIRLRASIRPSVTMPRSVIRMTPWSVPQLRMAILTATAFRDQFVVLTVRAPATAARIKAALVSSASLNQVAFSARRPATPAAMPSLRKPLSSKSS